MKTKTTKNILLIFLLATNSLFFAQYKVIYEMKWKADKKDSNFNKELCALVINKENTASFQSLENFRRDSLQTTIVKEYFKNQKGNLRLPDDRTDAKFSSIIIKDRANKSISLEEKLFTNVYITNCYQSLNWKLLNSTEPKIFGYSVKRAKLNFGGRNWTAFYTTEIPFPEGPYKFGGLPGLILKIYDDELDYTFEIKGVTKEVNNLEERNFSYNTVNLTYKKWSLFWSKYKNQPSMIFENLNTAETTFVIDGQDVNNKDVKASYDKREKIRLGYFDNPIEITPSCK
ncbi:GLPGLI family protein [Chryseobacterium aahli]|uniref:GLPGLI family protein n=1 Tax=Chryseobacterium aahli TaxID=1278643 RepID=UPI001F616EE7|nr:GLPGLI family protein [Chryseobacterium aahli]MCI3938565.1 GLPGLI family protein [Chryseobacterium aahli]